MTWFSYLDLNTPANTLYPPVRRKIYFPTTKENLKVGDWIYVSLSDVNIGLKYVLNGGSIESSFDQDSFLVTYEVDSTKTVTYSYIDQDSKLYFKSVTDVAAGNVPLGSYYIYYHSDNIQYLEPYSSTYKRTISPSGSNYMATTTGSGPKVVNFYSTEISGSTNDRVQNIAYISTTGIWQDQKSDVPGNKVMGIFDGPLLKIYGDKTINSGKIKVKIIKTSAAGMGQSIVKEDVVDLFSQSSITDSVIYSFNAVLDSSITTQKELTGLFTFEIEILNDKNISSSGNNVRISKYAFSSNYELEIQKEEIYDGIVFISTGVIR